MIKLYKYRQFSTDEYKNRLQRMIQKSELFCAKYEQLNDPYDCNIGTANHLMDHLINFGVFCASGEKHNDILLYSHYACGHTGLCLEFMVDGDRIIGETSFLGFTKPLDYVQNFPRFDRNNIHRLPWTKYRVWDYEDEYRAPCSFDKNLSQIRHYEFGELKSVRFGVKMNYSDKEIIRAFLKDSDHKDVKIMDAYLKQDQFSLGYRQIG